MAETTEALPGAPHNPAPTGADPSPKDPNEGKVVLSKEQHDELIRRASVSSQNFERAQKAEEKIDELKAEIQQLTDSTTPSGFEDERVGKLQSEIADIKAKEAKREVLEASPQLKEVWSDFEKWRSDDENKGMTLKTAAKVFLAEKGLIEGQTPRRGLETPTGGDRTPIVSGMSPDEVKRLRETDYRKYREMLKKGQIKIAA